MKKMSILAKNQSFFKFFFSGESPVEWRILFFKKHWFYDSLFRKIFHKHRCFKQKSKLCNDLPHKIFLRFSSLWLWLLCSICKIHLWWIFLVCTLFTKLKKYLKCLYILKKGSFVKDSLKMCAVNSLKITVSSVCYGFFLKNNGFFLKRSQYVKLSVFFLIFGVTE